MLQYSHRLKLYDEKGKSMIRKIIKIDEEKCNGCGLCATLCPLNNIEIVDGKPEWGKNCTHCMACINHCPKKAIEYGEKSKGKPRYHLD